MDEKALALDLLVKGTNLCRFLSGEKSEALISERFFSAVCEFTECCFSLKNPSLGKNELAALRKTASLEQDKISLYLESLYISGFISAAQKSSVVQTLDTLKKEINL